MLDYVLNLDVFRAGAENVLACLTYSLIAEYGDIERPNLLRLFRFIELVDSLDTLSNSEKEQAISYLLDRYNIGESTNSPFNNNSLGAILNPSFSSNGEGGAVYWEDVLDKPVSQEGTNANNLAQFVLDTIGDIDVSTTEDIVVAPGITGLGVNPGDVISMGTSLTEALKRLLIKISYPSYTAPRGSLTSSISGYREVGSSISNSLTGSFDKQDGGAINKYELKRDSTIIQSDSIVPISTAEFTDTIVVPEGTTTYSAKFYFDEGAVKNSVPDNVPYPVGKIDAGSVLSNGIQVTGIMPWFYGSSISDTVPSIYSAFKNVSPSNGSLNVPSFGTGDKYLWFAVPRNSSNGMQKTFSTWFRSALDSGSIGGSANLFRSPITVSVTSTGLTTNWTRNYDLYFSNYATGAGTSTTLN